MAEARRQQLRYSMLPHVGGKKFDVETFLKTGAVNEYKYHAPPMSDAMRKAIEEVEAERLMNERRRHGEK